MQHTISLPYTRPGYQIFMPRTRTDLDDKLATLCQTSDDELMLSLFWEVFESVASMSQEEQQERVGHAALFIAVHVAIEHEFHHRATEEQIMRVYQKACQANNIFVLEVISTMGEPQTSDMAIQCLEHLLVHCSYNTIRNEYCAFVSLALEVPFVSEYQLLERLVSRHMWNCVTMLIRLLVDSGVAEQETPFSDQIWAIFTQGMTDTLFELTFHQRFWTHPPRFSHLFVLRMASLAVKYDMLYILVELLSTGCLVMNTSTQVICQSSVAVPFTAINPALFWNYSSKWVVRWLIRKHGNDIVPWALQYDISQHTTNRLFGFHNKLEVLGIENFSWIADWARMETQYLLETGQLYKLVYYFSPVATRYHERIVCVTLLDILPSIIESLPPDALQVRGYRAQRKMGQLLAKVLPNA